MHGTNIKITFVVILMQIKKLIDIDSKIGVLYRAPFCIMNIFCAYGKQP